MLIKNPGLVVVGATVVAALWAGCTIKEVDPGTTIETTSNNSTSVTSGSTTGVGGDATTGTTTAGVGGGGGGVVDCVGDTGSTDTAAVCDELAISPAFASSICDDNGGVSGSNPPPGHGACIRSFDLYTQGSFDNFVACLDTISVQPAEACAFEPVIDCVTEVYDEACDRVEIDEACDAFAATCGADPYDAQKCKDDLRPFSDAGLQIYVDCFNNPPHDVQPCQQAHDECFVEIQ